MVSLEGFEPAATRSWDFPRQVAGTALLVEAGVDAGLDVDVLLQGSDLGPRDLADHQREVTAAQELRVLRNLRNRAPSVTGGSVGARYHASTFGPLGFALLSSPTLGHAANLALRFIDLSFTFTIPSATVDSEQVVITVDDRGVPVDVRDFLVQRDLTAIGRVLQEIAGGGLAAEHRASTSESPGALRFDSSWLEHPLPQANPHAFALAEAMCRDLVSPRRSRHGIVEHVRIHVAQRLESGSPMPDVAAALGLSERSLRRRLSDAGTSYRTVVDEVRHDVAEDLLAAGTLRVEDVAHRLGYAESTSFGAAYRRWTGHAPSQR
ncbi:hypothetical protein ASE01_18065 [Nocardioides sp. Root190]|uniref:AraC family transcriptional regulator n=1 Tax=Nocardioides sp. Root190 TaxID=1736488 RepID=UPI0006F79FBE|nr:AraC family transcriptional regulator [Nocardioides sp. Root190]KRB73911.1 hypothetical protein ASE01_18065 [Nocardioides sp. Root190]